MYETIKGKETLRGLIVVETDDLFGGGIGPNFQKAVETLRKTYQFGKWKKLKDGFTGYGEEDPSDSFQISVSKSP